MYFKTKCQRFWTNIALLMENADKKAGELCTCAQLPRTKSGYCFPAKVMSSFPLKVFALRERAAPADCREWMAVEVTVLMP